MLTIFILSMLFGKKPSDVKEVLLRKNIFFTRARILMTITLLLVMNAGNSKGYNTSNWRFSNPKQFGFTVLDVDYFDNNNVIAVGNDGGIARSTDGGKNWTYGPFTYVNSQGQVTKSSFSDVHYITATVAYAV